MLKSAIAGSAAAALLAICGVANAADDFRLSFKDLDLGQPQDAQVFRARMRSTAAKLCSAEVLTGTRLDGRTRCEAGARDDMLASLPAQTRAVYLDALKGRASDKLAKAGAPQGAAVTATIASPN